MSAAEKLIRGMGRRDLVALLINVVIGAGILGLPAKSFALVGAYSVLAWVLCALVMGVIAACFAEVGSQFAQTGGPYIYAHEAFGPTTGYFVGWLAWVSRLFSFATIANLAMTYLGGAFPVVMSGGWRVSLIVLTCIVLTGLLLVGIRRSAFVNNLLTTCKLILLVGFVVACLPFVEVSRLAPGPAPAAADWQAAIMLMTFAFIGIESAMITSGEMKNPRTDLPFALGTALLVIAGVYVAIQVVSIGALPGLATSQRPLVDAAAHNLGPIGAHLINAGAMVTMFGTLFAIQFTGSRLPFALAEQGQLPQRLAAVHPHFKTPHVAIIVTGICSCVLALYSSFLGALVVSTLTRLVGYLTTCAALMVLRSRKSQTERRGFRIPAGWLCASVGVAASAWLMSGSTQREIINVAVVALIGAVIGGGYALYRRWAVPSVMDQAAGQMRGSREP